MALRYLDPRDEAERVDVVHALGVLDTGPEERFDRIVRLAARLTGAPISLVSLVDAQRQVFKARVGLDVRETPRSDSFCAHAIQSPDPFVVEDLAEDARFRHTSLVSGPPHLRFYAGIPLIVRGGHCVGTLCVMDTAPRTVCRDDLDHLSGLAAIAVDELDRSRPAPTPGAQGPDVGGTPVQTQDVLDSLSSGFFAVDAAWRVTHMNLAAELLLQQRRDALIGQDLWTSFPEAVGSDFERHYRAAVETRVSQRFEAYFAPLDTWFAVRAFPLAAGLSVYFDDVTERHAFEAERSRHLQDLSARDAAFGAFADNSPDLIVRFGRDLRVTYVNRSVEDATGLPRARLLGIHATEADRANERHPSLARSLTEVVETGQVHRVRFAFPDVQGAPLHYDALLVPECDRGSVVQSVLMIGRDVTPQTTAQTELEKSERRYRALATAASSLVWRMSADGTSSLELIGGTLLADANLAVDAGNWLDYVHPGDRERVMEEWYRCIRQRTPAEIQYRALREGGPVRWFRVRAVPVLGANGDVEEWLGTHTDITEQKQAETRLSNSEARFRSLVQNSSEVITLLAADGTVVYQSPSSRRLLGRDPEAFVGRSIFEFVHPDDAPSISAIFAAFVAGEPETRVELRLLSGDGEWRWLEAVGTNLLDDPQVGAVVINSRDVTGRIEAQQSLEESEQKYRTLVEQSGQIVYDHNLVSDTIAWSGNTYPITGHTPEELAETRVEMWSDHLHPDDREQALALLETSLREGVPYVAAYRFRHADGSYRHIEDRGGVMLQAQVPHLVGVMTDVTRRVEHEEAIAMSESRYRTLSTLIKTFAYAYVVPEDGSLPTIEWATGSVEDVIGWPAADLVGRPWGGLQDDSRKQERLAALLSGERRTDDVRVIGKDGRAHWVRLHMWPEADPTTGRIVRIHAGGKDVTLFKEAEAALIRAREESDRARVSAEQARERAEEMARLKGAFLANMSHEIRTPLTGILGFASLLHEEVTEQGREFVDVIEAAGRRLSETLASVLELSQIQSGHVELDMAPLDVGDRLEETAELFRDQARQKGLRLHVDAPPRPLVAALDKSAVDRILSNLVSNAVKYSTEGTVTLSAHADAGWLEIVVSDTGIGIAAEYLPHVFEEFRQESSGLARMYEGAGLGLAICSRLAELMGGTIRAESQKGVGSTFTVRLPLRPAEPEPSVDAAPPPSPPTRRRVLVVEDIDETRMLLELLLDEVHDATFAATPDQALAASGPFDVVLLDINLGTGQMTGVDLLPRLRQTAACATARFVAVTAYALPGDRERFLAAGFDRYVAKPFDPLGLLQSMDDA